MDFLCINCQELISSERISSHSLFCVYPLESVISIEEQGAVLQLVFRLGKLKSALVGRAEEAVSGGDKELYEFLVTQANEVMGVGRPREDTLERCKATISSLERYSKALVSTPVLLYNERLRVLAMEAVKVMEEESKEGETNALDIKYREIMIAKENVLKGNFGKAQNIDEISSQISQIWNNRPSTSSVTTPDEEIVNEVNELDDMFMMKEKEHVKQTAEDLQRYFFSKCLAKKLSFPIRDPAQYIQIPDLYKNVMEIKLPVEKWGEYIDDQFKHPDRWLNTSLIHK